jgi:Protein of unknown function (DUF3775)
MIVSGVWALYSTHFHRRGSAALRQVKETFGAKKLTAVKARSNDAPYKAGAPQGGVKRAVELVVTTPVDKLAYIIGKAREFDALVDEDDPDSGSNPADDFGVAILESGPDNPSEDELEAALASLNDDQLTELLALLWVGRGDFDRESWADAIRQAREAKNKRIVRYLVGTPMLGDLIEEGLAELGVTVPLPQEEG